MWAASSNPIYDTNPMRSFVIYTIKWLSETDAMPYLKSLHLKNINVMISLPGCYILTPAVPFVTLQTYAVTQLLINPIKNYLKLF